MKNYEQLKSVIQKANPEIMELHIGDKVEYKSAFGDSKIATFNGYRYKDSFFKGEKKEFIGTVEYDDVWLDHIKILGRPIRLADVLLALTEKYAKDENDRWIFFGNEKQIILQTFAQWNLKNDNLDNQSDETKQFLMNLLVF